MWHSSSFNSSHFRYYIVGDKARNLMTLRVLRWIFFPEEHRDPNLSNTRYILGGRFWNITFKIQDKIVAEISYQILHMVVVVQAMVPQSELDLELVKSILSEYRIHNADITLRFIPVPIVSVFRIRDYELRIRIQKLKIRNFGSGSFFKLELFKTF